MNPFEAEASGTKPTQLRNPVPGGDQSSSNQESISSYKAPQVNAQEQMTPSRDPASVQNPFEDMGQMPTQEAQQQPPEAQALPQDQYQQQNIAPTPAPTPAPQETMGNGEKYMFGSKFRINDGVAERYNDKDKKWEAPSTGQKLWAGILLQTIANAPAEAAQLATTIGVDASGLPPIAGQIAGAGAGSFAASLNESAFNKIKEAHPEYINMLEKISGGQGEPMDPEQTAKLNALTGGFGLVAGAIAGPLRNIVFNRFTAEQAGALKSAFKNIGETIGITPENFDQFFKKGASNVAKVEKGAYGNENNIFDHVIEKNGKKISDLSSHIDSELQNAKHSATPLYDKIKETLKNKLPNADLLFKENGDIDFNKLKVYSKSISSDTNSAKSLLDTILDIHNEANLDKALAGTKEASSSIVDQFGSPISKVQSEINPGFTYSGAKKLRQSLQETAAKTGDSNIKLLARDAVEYEADIIKNGLESSGKEDLANQLMAAKENFTNNINSLNDLSDTLKKGVKSGNIGSAVWQMSPEQITYMKSVLNDSPEAIKDFQMSVLSNTLAHEGLNNASSEINAKYIYNSFFKNPTISQKTKALFGDEMYGQLKSIVEKAQILDSSAVVGKGQDGLINSLVGNIAHSGLSLHSAGQFVSSLFGTNRKAQEAIMQKLENLSALTGEMKYRTAPSLSTKAYKGTAKALQGIEKAARFGTFNPPIESISSQKDQ